MISNILTIIFLLFSLFLFYNTKPLKLHTIKTNRKISVIIPARNEEINLPKLLYALKNEAHLIHEIIIVNDDSNDNTENIARSFNVKLINISQHPHGWTGKNYCCFKGAQEANGEILLFLDADLIPQNDMIKKLQSNYKANTVLSIPPYHYTEKFYEQFSLFFNTISIAAVGVCLPCKDKSIGLFGPLIMLDKKLYFNFGGHSIVKDKVLEDYHLGFLLNKMGIKTELFLGYESVSYQMYKSGILSLIWGWSKNFASGAIKTPLVHLVPVVLWIMSYYTIAIEFIKNIVLYFIGSGNIQITIFHSVLYVFAGVLLFLKVRKFGNFSFITCVFYIIPLTAFTLIFMLSLILKFIVKKVYWKGRWNKI